MIEDVNTLKNLLSNKFLNTKIETLSEIEFLGIHTQTNREGLEEEISLWKVEVMGVYNGVLDDLHGIPEYYKNYRKEFYVFLYKEKDNTFGFQVAI